MAGFQDLGQELIAMILANLYEPPRPRRALRHASLVCRSFYAVSSKYLFEHILLDPLSPNIFTCVGLEETMRRSVRRVTVPLWHRIPTFGTVPIFGEFLGTLPNLELVRATSPNDPKMEPRLHWPPLEPLNLQRGFIEMDACFASYDMISRLESYANICSLRVHFLSERCDHGSPPYEFSRSKSQLVRDIISNNPKLSKLSLHLPLRGGRDFDEEENAIRRLCPVLSQIRILELEGEFRLPESLWTSLDTPSISSLALYNFELIRPFTHNLVGRLPQLRELKISAYPSPKTTTLPDQASFAEAKDSLFDFLLSAQIEDLTIWHFDNDMLYRALQATGSSLRRLQFHHARPLIQDIASCAHLRSPGSLLSEGFCTIDSISQMAPYVLEIGLDLSLNHLFDMSSESHPGLPPRPPLPTSSTSSSQICPPSLPELSTFFHNDPPAPLPFLDPTIELPLLFPLPSPNFEPLPKILNGFAGFRSLKHIGFIDLFPHRQIKPDVCVRAFCYLRKWKQGVMLESMEISTQDVVYRIWENGPTECICMFYNYTESIEQIWETKEMKLVEENRQASDSWTHESSRYW